MYPKSNIPWIVQSLKFFMKTNKLTQSKLSELTKVDQGQISRILAGQCSGRGDAIIKLCKYAHIDAHNPSPDPIGSLLLMETIKEVWDGTESGARAIVDMLRAARRMPH
ncbi:helix-turn-helix domain-containing protein [Andreprevotia lacus]|jgi:transcriptional regulator with XRE-family HTH domain|uniref:helix-turn-helix domain-containing protein n=1 Tax=Andreprevotia lacus TaxID=1121000 RepID=UPI00111BD1EE|nr:helix-turn-helix transcriptional regulator [Andreprevotia lacus]